MMLTEIIIGAALGGGLGMTGIVVTALLDNMTVRNLINRSKEVLITHVDSKKELLEEDHKQISGKIESLEKKLNSLSEYSKEIVRLSAENHDLIMENQKLERQMAELEEKRTKGAINEKHA